MLNQLTHALIIDNSTQWFAYIISYLDTRNQDKNGKTTIKESYHLSSEIENHNPFVMNIYNRQYSFGNEKFDIFGVGISSYYGYYLSEYDFNRIKRMIEIYPVVCEFNRLKQL